MVTMLLLTTRCRNSCKSTNMTLDKATRVAIASLFVDDDDDDDKDDDDEDDDDDGDVDSTWSAHTNTTMPMTLNTSLPSQ